MKELVLIIDDSWNVKEELEALLRSQYSIVRTSSYKNSLEILEENAVSLIFLNNSLSFSGDILDYLSFNKYSVPIIFVCSNASLYYKGNILYDYITLPFISHLIKNKVKVLIELNNYKKNYDEFKKLQEKRTHDMVDVFSSTVCSLIEYRNIETGSHVKRISSFTKCILEFLSKNLYDDEFTQRNINMVATASMLHDIGLIGIPDAILNKSTPLTIDEQVVLSRHTVIGCKIIEKLRTTENNEDFINTCHDICKHHHERWDGSGYPNKYSGEDIPISAQVVGMADTYDYLTSKKNYLHEQAINLIKSGEAGSFSPVLLETINLIPDELSYFKEQYQD